MKLSDIKKKANAKKKRLGTYHIDEGEHEGVIKSAKYDEEKDRIYLTIELTDGTVFKSSAESADYNDEPLFNVIEPFAYDDGEINFDEIKDYEIIFTTKNNESKDGHIFSNITEFEYLLKDED